ncbi:hypothetical protein [Marinobacter sp. SS21]|uniref:hypothetical protein n=1 Tax=Marinobacter sp. SS21 TaxID=2979460 RepID=UPI00232B6018|nr:hypothetical protein [Marinobacter sp. SS21]MDC0661342.1 hypothetical protein [Marinobacter sp. SS21]
MRHPEPYRTLAAVSLATLMSACASTPWMASHPQSAPATADGDTREQRPQPPCAWSQVRGIAKLLSLGRHPDRSQASWQFFPGDDVLFHPAPPGSRVGDEYKALLRRPMNGPCRQLELYLVAPI